MKYYDLTKEEQELELAFEHGEFESAADFEERKKELEAVAKSTLNKNTNINIRLSEKDVYKLKALAVEEGLPYQTLVASILHKTASRH
jgi:predicted DNA binding CopG/RHH family protein